MKKTKFALKIASLVLIFLFDLQLFAQSQPSTNMNLSYSPEVALQLSLSFAGHNPGTIDGIIGNGTIRALKEFQKSKYISPSGNLDYSTISSLKLSLSDKGSSVLLVRLREQLEKLEDRKLSLKTTERLSGYTVDYKGRIVPRVAENGSYYGEISTNTYRPKTVHVKGYYRKDGTYVRGHYRSRPKRK